jgi:hypothetical protein
VGLKIENNTKETKCYSFDVNMVIQILAEDEKTAIDQLNKQGGYITKRDVSLRDVVILFNGDSDE